MPAGLCYSCRMIKSRYFLSLLILPWFGLLLTACAELPAPVPPAGTSLQLVTVIDPEEVFAGSPDLNLIALGKGGLQLLDVPSGEVRRLDSQAPLALGWRHDGIQLAAAFAANDGKGRLVIFARDGQVVANSELPGTPVALIWSRRDDLLVAGYNLRTFSFGSSLTQWLVRINGAEQEQTTIGDATLKPATTKAVRDRLSDLLKVAFSPEGDELVVLQLHDPPQFPAYLQATHRNWQVAGERKLVQFPVQPVALHWGADADELAYRSGPGPWRVLPLWPPAGSSSSITALTADLPEEWGAETRLQRFANGDYLLAGNGRLYIGHHLPPRLDEADAGTAWMLRKWRFEGLISPEEYQEVRP